MTETQETPPGPSDFDESIMAALSSVADERGGDVNFERKDQRWWAYKTFEENGRTCLVRVKLDVDDDGSCQAVMARTSSNGEEFVGHSLRRLREMAASRAFSTPLRPEPEPEVGSANPGDTADMPAIRAEPTQDSFELKLDD